MLAYSSSSPPPCGMGTPFWMAVDESNTLETKMNTKNSLEPLVLACLSNLLPKLLTMNKIKAHEFAFLLLVVCPSVASVENLLYVRQCADSEPPNPGTRPAT